jgi:4-hydroxy 2-oxovalerate aldolase
MNKVRVLDCTLRDGGYCNQWMFGYDNIRKIVNGLLESRVDIVELGFLTNKVVSNSDRTKFSSMEDVSNIIPQNREGKMYVCLLNYGEYELSDIPPYDGTSFDGIRVAFHKHDAENALKLCAEIKKKGYQVYIQAMVSLNYTDEEFLSIIRTCNEFEPYAFYIVDSFGVMKRKDLTRLFYIVEHNLKENIFIGFHAHNNMQLAYSNAQSLVDAQTKRSIIIDTSIFGMGRGAGNLNTELFLEYLNDNIGTEYDLKPLLNVIDDVINKFYQTNYWGYSLPNYLSAAYNSHPDYASYLDDKKTLTFESMDDIFKLMSDEKRSTFDKKYIEELYVRYLMTGKTYEEHLAELKYILTGKKVLIIAPGKSVEDEKEKVIECANQDDIISFSINFDYFHFNTDFIFVSNLRRFRTLDISKRRRAIATSNILEDNVYLKTSYAKLLNNEESVRDNAGMMLIKFLILLGVDDIWIAGFDGYSHEETENYADEKMSFVNKNSVFDALNVGMKKVLTEYAKDVNIRYLTTPKYISI